MNLHRNARTCPKSRALMAIRVIKEHAPVSSVAEQFGVSRSTVYKWFRRYRDWGNAGLTDLSSEPRVLQHRIGENGVALTYDPRTGSDTCKWSAVPTCRSVEKPISLK